MRQIQILPDVPHPQMIPPLVAAQRHAAVPSYDHLPERTGTTSLQRLRQRRRSGGAVVIHMLRADVLLLQRSLLEVLYDYDAFLVGLHAMVRTGTGRNTRNVAISCNGPTLVGPYESRGFLAERIVVDYQQIQS